MSCFQVSKSSRKFFHVFLTSPLAHTLKHWRNEWSCLKCTQVWDTLTTAGRVLLGLGLGQQMGLRIHTSSQHTIPAWWPLAFIGCMEKVFCISLSSKPQGGEAADMGGGHLVAWDMGIMCLFPIPKNFKTRVCHYAEEVNQTCILVALSFSHDL